jgi:hypothetical protein
MTLSIILQLYYGGKLVLLVEKTTDLSHLQDHNGSLDYINKTGKSLIGKAASEDKATKLKTDLDEF